MIISCAPIEHDTGLEFFEQDPVTIGRKGLSVQGAAFQAPFQGKQWMPGWGKAQFMAHSAQGVEMDHKSVKR